MMFYNLKWEKEKNDDNVIMQLSTVGQGSIERIVNNFF